MFIARVHVVMKVYRLSKGSIGYKGNIINMEQDIQPVINKLPLIPSELPIFVTRKSNPNALYGYKDFMINRENILKWLQFLKKFNKHYKNIEIDYDSLEKLPIDGSIYNDLRTYNIDIDDNKDEESNTGGVEEGPAQGNATGPYPDEENAKITEAYACINHLHQNETNEQNISIILCEELGT